MYFSSVVGLPGSRAMAPSSSSSSSSSSASASSLPSPLAAALLAPCHRSLPPQLIPSFNPIYAHVAFLGPWKRMKQLQQQQPPYLGSSTDSMASMVLSPAGRPLTSCKASQPQAQPNPKPQAQHSALKKAIVCIPIPTPPLSHSDFAKALSSFLPYAVMATAIAALVQPATFTWVRKEYYAPALGGIMLSIGIQLSVKDFEIVLKRPKPVIAGYASQYIAKPLLGAMIARAFRIPEAFASGFVLTACVAGAQLSSYATYLSDGDVALSIVLTSLSTITSVVITPLLTGLLIGSVVPVDGIAMAKSILQVVFCPVLLGLALNTYAKPVVDIVRPGMPVMAMLCTSLCIGGPLALNRGHILSLQGLQLLFPVIAFHIAGFLFGYWMAMAPALRLEERTKRTLSLCTGMQSSTLAGVLATQFLGGSQAVPPACSVVVMAVMGLGLASFWASGNTLSSLLHPLIPRSLST